MIAEYFYYQCSRESIASISDDLYAQITETIELLPEREQLSDINFDLFWLLTSVGWQFESVPVGISATPPDCLELECTLSEIQPANDRATCRTSTSLGIEQHADYAMQFDAGLVHVEVQFGNMENLFTDYCGFRLTHAEERLALGIEIVMSEHASPLVQTAEGSENKVTFQLAKETLETIGLTCPVWLIGIS